MELRWKYWAVLVSDARLGHERDKDARGFRKR